MAHDQSDGSTTSTNVQGQQQQKPCLIPGNALQLDLGDDDTSTALLVASGPFLSIPQRTTTSSRSSPSPSSPSLSSTYRPPSPEPEQEQDKPPQTPRVRFRSRVRIRGLRRSNPRTPRSRSRSHSRSRSSDSGSRSSTVSVPLNMHAHPGRGVLGLRLSSLAARVVENGIGNRMAPVDDGGGGEADENSPLLAFGRAAEARRIRRQVRLDRVKRIREEQARDEAYEESEEEEGGSGVWATVDSQWQAWRRFVDAAACWCCTPEGSASTSEDERLGASAHAYGPHR